MKKIIIILIYFMLFFTFSYSQTLENTSFFEIKPLFLIPNGTIVLNHKTGIGIAGSYNHALGDGLYVFSELAYSSIPPEIDIRFTKGETSQFDLTFGGLALLAPEAASTFYLKGDIGLYFVSTNLTGKIIPDIKISENGKFGFGIGTGYLIAPEHWEKLMFNIEGEYKYILLSNYNWSNVRVLFGIGFRIN